MKFIDIISNRTGEDRRVSHLTVEKNGTLRVGGNLPHGYEFEPINKYAAEKHIAYLRRWIKNNPDKETI